MIFKEERDNGFIITDIQIANIERWRQELGRKRLAEDPTLAINNSGAVYYGTFGDAFKFNVRKEANGYKITAIDMKLKAQYEVPNIYDQQFENVKIENVHYYVMLRPDTFSLHPTEWEMFDEWMAGKSENEHELEFVFSPTGIALCTTVRSIITGESISITNIDLF